MTDAFTSQAGLLGLGQVEPTARTSQAGVTGLGTVVPYNAVSQAGLVVLGTAGSCGTRRCQLWSIERTDGMVLRFTSHDEDVTWGEDTYATCHSLRESASEQSAAADQVGNIDLEGLLDTDAISDDDLYAGIYNDAFVQVWRVAWGDNTDQAFRVAAGWLGNISHGERGWKGEVVGPGGRLLQQPLLQVVAPTCRWRFGDLTTCGIDADALAITGTVLSAATRSYLFTDVIDPGGSAQWDRGTLRFTYGRNTGQVCEVRDVDFDTGRIVLWVRSGFAPDAGDSFVLKPGCDLGFDSGCQAYDNRERHGGFPHVPGTDQVRQVPEQKA